MTDRKSIMSQFSEQGAFFDVGTRSLKTIDGTLVRSRVAVVREDDGEVLGVVSPTYKVVSNEAAFDAFLRAMESISVDLEGARASTQYAGYGAKTLAQLILPSMEYDNGGDKTQMRIIMMNSYDGSWKLQVFGGGLRGACTNGQVFGKSMAKYASRHIRSLSIQAASDKIAMAFQQWRDNKALWDTMHCTAIADKDAFVLAAAYAGDKNAVKLGMPTKDTDWPTSRIFEQVWNQWQIEKRGLGQNYWAMYNALTHHATHHDGGYEDTRAATLARREEQVGRVIDMPFSQALLKAA